MRRRVGAGWLTERGVRVEEQAGLFKVEHLREGDWVADALLGRHRRGRRDWNRHHCPVDVDDVDLLARGRSAASQRGSQRFPK